MTDLEEIRELNDMLRSHLEAMQILNVKLKAAIMRREIHEEMEDTSI